MKCHKRICNSHSVKCQICNKRACKDKNCIYDFRICQLCGCTYCQEHFDIHKKFNTQEPMKLKCSSEQCKITTPLNAKTIIDFSILLVNIHLLKELRIQSNNLSGEIIFGFSRSIKELPFLEVLCLNNGNLDDSSIVILSQSLCDISNLRILNVDINCIGDNGALSLTNCIEKQFYLQELVISTKLNRQ